MWQILLPAIYHRFVLCYMVICIRFVMYLVLQCQSTKALKNALRNVIGSQYKKNFIQRDNMFIIWNVYLIFLNVLKEGGYKRVPLYCLKPWKCVFTYIYSTFITSTNCNGHRYKCSPNIPPSLNRFDSLFLVDYKIYIKTFTTNTF